MKLPETNEQWEERILGRRVGVSDTRMLTSASAPIGCYDPDRGMIYTAYHGARAAYGEQFTVLAMLELPIMQPHRAQTSVLLESDVPVNGVPYHLPVDAFSIFYEKKVRVFFLANADNYYYLDYDPADQSVSEIKPVMCTYEGLNTTVPLTADIVDRYLQSQGMSGYDLHFDRAEHIICTAKPARDGNAFYGTVTSGLMQPIVWKCEDAMTFRFKGVIPKLAKYECQIAFADQCLYALLRGAEGSNYYTSEDEGKTFAPAPYRVPHSETRPQLLNYDGKIMMAISLMDVKPNKMRNGRNNMRLMVGKGPDIRQYQEIFTLVDPYGIVYYDLIDYKGALYMLWSNSELYVDKLKNGMVHGKDLLLFSRIGDLTELWES